MKARYLFIAMTLIISSIACQNQTEKTTQDTTSAYEVPALLDRPEAVQMGEEWDMIQNMYGESKLAISKNPKKYDAYLTLAEVFVMEARVTGEHGHYYPAALEILNKVVAEETKPSDIRFRALALKTSVLLSQHDFSEALATGKAAVAINPYNAQVYGGLVDAYVELGDYENAIKAADKMTSIRPDLRSYSRISYLREIHGDVEGSIEAMKLAIESGYPGMEQTAWTRLTLGDIYTNYGRLSDASMQYRAAIQERDNYPFAIAALADVAIKEGRYDEAETLLKQACNIIPEFGFYEQLANLYQETGREEEAKEIIAEIFVMLEDDVVHGHNMNFEYATLHLETTKDLDKALEYALIEYQKRPDNIDVNKLLAFIYFERGEIETARKHVDVATRTNSKNPELLCVRGLIALKEGKTAEAKADIKAAFAANPFQSHCLANQAKDVLG